MFPLRNHSAAKLTAAQVLEIRERYAQGGITQAQLSREYLVGLSTIRNILTGVSWQSVPMPETAASQDAAATASLQRFKTIGDLRTIANERESLPGADAPEEAK
jgi:hypothetical protein